MRRTQPANPQGTLQKPPGDIPAAFNERSRKGVRKFVSSIQWPKNRVFAELCFNQRLLSLP